MPTMRYHDSKIQCELTLSPRVNVRGRLRLRGVWTLCYDRLVSVVLEFAGHETSKDRATD